MENENKKPFHLTITDNETGETVRDLDFDAIIGAVHLSEEQAGGLYITKCSVANIAATVVAAESLLDHIQHLDPSLRLLKLGFGLRTEEVKEETEGTAN